MYQNQHHTDLDLTNHFVMIIVRGVLSIIRMWKIQMHVLWQIHVIWQKTNSTVLFGRRKMDDIKVVGGITQDFDTFLKLKPNDDFFGPYHMVETMRKLKPTGYMTAPICTLTDGIILSARHKQKLVSVLMNSI